MSITDGRQSRRDGQGARSSALVISPAKINPRWHVELEAQAFGSSGANQAKQAKCAHSPVFRREAH